MSTPERCRAQPAGAARLAAVAVGLISLLAYLWTAGPTFYWLDSSELTAAAWGLGVAHPPGHPLASLLGRLCCLVPVGTLSFRVSLASALQAAGAAALLTLLAERLLGRLELGTPSRRAWCAALASLAVGLSSSVWFQAVRAEVYALNLLLLVAIANLLLGWDHAGDRRRLVAAAFLAGLALCNHHLLVLLGLPVMLLFVLLRRPAAHAGRRLPALVLAAGLAGLVPLAYLPLRARRLPEVNWGSPHTIERFAWTVSARAFQPALDRAAQQPWQERLGGAGFALLGGLGPVSGLLALGGLYLLWRSQQTRRAALLLSGGAAANLVAPLMVGFDPFNPDAHGYLAVAVALVAPGLAVMVAATAEGLERWRSRGGRPAALAALALAALLPATQLWRSARSCDLSRHWAAEETGRAALDVPPGALLLTSFFETLFNAWALRVTGDLRPDLQLVHRHFLDQPGYLEDLGRRWPWLAAATRSWDRGGEPGPKDLSAIAAERFLLVELDLDLDERIEARLGPAGFLLPRWATAGSRSAAALAAHLARVRAWRAAVGPVEESETRRALTWTHYLLARFGCRQAIPALAAPHLRWARELAPSDRRLQELAAACH